MSRSNKNPASSRAPGQRNPNPMALLDSKQVRIAARLSWLANFFSGPLYRELELTRGLTRPEFTVLHCLAQCPNVTAQDICVMTGQSKNNLSRAIRRLLRDGRIARTEDSGDARARLLMLTDRGTALYGELIGLFVRREQEMLRPLSVGERADLDRLLGKLVTRSDDWAQRY